MTIQEGYKREFFDTFADRYVRKDLNPYSRTARKLRLLRTLKNLSRPLGAVLEIGCGAGFAASYLQGGYSRYVGLDSSERLISYARQYNQNHRASFLIGDAGNLRLNEQFDLIFMIGVLHHLPHLNEVLVRLKFLLRPGGVIVANEPQKGNPLISWLRRLRKKTDRDYSDEQVELSEEDLRSCFESCGFQVRLFPQGVFSTPLAETQFLPPRLGTPLSALAKGLDPILEELISGSLLRRLSWNVVVEGRLPGSAQVPEA